MTERYAFRTLEAMSEREFNDFLDGIDDEQALDSECGGDSDADDIMPETFPANTSRDNVVDSNDSCSGIPPSPKRFRNAAISDSEDSDENDEPPSSATYNFTKNSTNSSAYKSSRFSQGFGPHVDIDLESPLANFSQFFTPDFLEYIVSESNLYAHQKGNELNLTVVELKAFLGLLIIMGFHQLPSIRHYWSSDSNFHVTRVSEVMSVRRFLKILRYLHLNDSEKMPKKGEDGYDKLYKVRPMILHLKNEFLKSFSPGRNISIDESMVAFKGRTSLKQYMPMKPIKRGFKIWVAACAESGYMLNFEVYEGKAEVRDEGSLGERVILALSLPFQLMGYCLFFDRFFTTLPLLTKLLYKCTYACGTMLQNRKFFPKSILKPDKSLKFGESDFAMSGEISVMKWKDRGTKAVVVASNMHDPTEMCQISRRNKKGEKELISSPQAISDYNQFMGGVDKYDQLMASYSISWKSRRWWVKLFYYFVDASIVNSFIMYYETAKLAESYTSKPITHVKYRTILANQLIGDFTSKKKSGPAASPKVIITKSKFTAGSQNKYSHSNPIVLTNVGVHLPEEGTKRRCALCSTKKNPKRSSVACRECKVALCVKCFVPFHLK